MIKFNQDYDPERSPKFEGERQQLVSDRVARAVLRLLRERTSAELVCADTTVFKRDLEDGYRFSTQLSPVLQEFDVHLTSTLTAGPRRSTRCRVADRCSGSTFCRSVC